MSYKQLSGDTPAGGCEYEGRWARTVWQPTPIPSWPEPLTVSSFQKGPSEARAPWNTVISCLQSVLPALSSVRAAPTPGSSQGLAQRWGHSEALRQWRQLWGKAASLSTFCWGLKFGPRLLRTDLWIHPMYKHKQRNGTTTSGYRDLWGSRKGGIHPDSRIQDHLLLKNKWQKSHANTAKC